MDPVEWHSWDLIRQLLGYFSSVWPLGSTSCLLMCVPDNPKSLGKNLLDWCIEVLILHRIGSQPSCNHSKENLVLHTQVGDWPKLGVWNPLLLGQNSHSSALWNFTCTNCHHLLSFFFLYCHMHSALRFSHSLVNSFIPFFSVGELVLNSSPTFPSLSYCLHVVLPAALGQLSPHLVFL